MLNKLVYILDAKITYIKKWRVKTGVSLHAIFIVFYKKCSINRNGFLTLFTLDT